MAQLSIPDQNAIEKFMQDKGVTKLPVGKAQGTKPLRDFLPRESYLAYLAEGRNARQA